MTSDDETPVPIEILREPGLRNDAEEIFKAALAAVEPSRLLVRAFQALPTAIRNAIDARSGRLVVVGAGKASGAMAAALEDSLPDPKPLPGVEPAPPLDGLVVVKHGSPDPRLRRIALRRAGHPLPDAAGAAAAEETLALVAGLGGDDIAFAVISGGGSALWASPVEGVALEDLRATTELLLRSGATIVEMNAVRKHVTRLAGGQLARASRAAAMIAFVISDVPNDRLDSVAGGPTVADETTFEDAVSALERYDLLSAAPASVRVHLAQGVRGLVSETPKRGDPAFQRTRTIVIGSNRTALEAAAARARERGYAPVIMSGALKGEARKTGELIARRLKTLRGRGPRAILAGGETTVRVTGDGRGGRNQELALGAALELAGTRGVCVLAGGTDGEDGPTDAAGAVVDGATIYDAHAANLDPRSALERNDSYTLFNALGRLVKTGPTATNVMDLAVGLVE